MSNIQSRLGKLEQIQQAHRRVLSDAELAVRIDYLLEKGGPDAEKVRALLEKVGDDNAEP